ncbi:hypothetical protein DCS_03245 [Drechmeria coniospora]|uniref:Uncharacterized protein n=1 Tax=Drechmeria coniospora TaxID=98403 RepID=A0A151GYD6_DRECN|nr:hypothetical protein DCS_03245 [Drechmeria coniospora]KYK62100.1 hypothetical protein DCS_03245 [Drechmeria coniospora]
MSGMPRVDTAVLGTSIVGMADQIMQGVRDNRDHRPGNAQEHYVKAAIAGAIAVGAYKMLREDEDRERERGGKRHHRDGSADGSSDGGQGSASPRRHHGTRRESHGRDLTAEAIGAYAIGRQMMGHDDHAILKLVAEGLGAAALAREVDKDLVE